MARTLHDIERDALELPLEQRAELVRNLLSTLDPEEDLEARELWLQEAEKRHQEYRAGHVVGRPASDVFSKARRALE